MNYYEILGVNKTSNEEEIKKAYRKLAKEYHPDKGGDPERMKKINEAYAILSDPQKKALYDKPQFHDPLFGGGINFDEIFRMMGGTAFHFSQNIISHTMVVPLLKAILGGEVKTQTQAGLITFNLPAGIQSGETFQINVSKNKNSTTIIQLTIRVEIPKNLTEEQKTKLKEILK